MYDEEWSDRTPRILQDLSQHHAIECMFLNRREIKQPTNKCRVSKNTYNCRLGDLLNVNVFFRLPRLGPTTDTSTLRRGSWIDQGRIVGPNLLSLMMVMNGCRRWSRREVAAGKNSGAAFGLMG